MMFLTSVGLVLLGMIIGALLLYLAYIFKEQNDERNRRRRQEQLPFNVVDSAPKFRQRTAETDPNRRARVKEARVIARKGKV